MRVLGKDHLSTGKSEVEDQATAFHPISLGQKTPKYRDKSPGHDAIKLKLKK